MLQKIDSSGLEPSLIQEIREQGFLPGVELRLLRSYPTSDKIIVSLNGSIVLAIPMALAQKMNLKKIDRRKTTDI